MTLYFYESGNILLVCKAILPVGKQSSNYFGENEVLLDFSVFTASITVYNFKNRKSRCCCSCFQREHRALEVCKFLLFLLFLRHFTKT